jgi:phosphoserine phosphatase RsbU/P
LQGMIYSQLTAGMPLTEIVTAANRFFTHKHIGEKYATVILARVTSNGELEYVNCGHVPPLVVSGGGVQRPAEGNLPVGLLPDASYEGARGLLKPGDRLILVTDGVTEAENAQGEFFDDQRLELAAKTGNLPEIFAAISNFCQGTPLSDDCTVVELVYTG